MTTAVIRSGGQQHRVTEGDVIRVATLEGNPGDPVSFNEVLAILGDAPKVGTPTVAKASVAGQIVNHGLDEKLVVFKFRRRKRYRRKNGHRQTFTAVKITAINA
ncbi:MAG TPA: 50S ribosomal protein L21 [Polyangiaceae bacterium]|nr:50S ribosomal protein L21 [Polyangiaceae bacterium]